MISGNEEAVVFLPLGVYYYNSQKMSMLEIGNFCGHIGGHLVAFETEAEHSALVVPGNKYRIGAVKKYINGNWTWLWQHSQQSLNETFQAWGNNAGGYHNVIRNGDKWSTVPHTQKHDVVCEMRT